MGMSPQDVLHSFLGIQLVLEMDMRKRISEKGELLLEDNDLIENGEAMDVIKIDVIQDLYCFNSTRKCKRIEVNKCKLMYFYSFYIFLSFSQITYFISFPLHALVGGGIL